MKIAPLDFPTSPFAATPNPARYCDVESIGAARRRLMQAIDRAEGPGILVGPSGTGKTLLCQVLAQHYQAEYTVVLLAESRLCTRRALLQHVLFHLGLPFRDLSEGELRLSLLDHLRPEAPEDKGLLLIIDEAHLMPRRLLEELRMISGVVRNNKPRVRLILSGGMRLEETLADPRMESLEQRIATRAYLHPYSLDETRTYVAGVIANAGRQWQDVITDEAIVAAHHAADGIPRLLNRVLDGALQIGIAQAAPVVTRQMVDAAWSDLHQLPAPFADTPAAPREAGSESSVMEFGLLDDELPTESQDPWSQLPASPSERPSAADEPESDVVIADASATNETSDETANSAFVATVWQPQYDVEDYLNCCNTDRAGTDGEAKDLLSASIEITSESDSAEPNIVEEGEPHQCESLSPSVEEEIEAPISQTELAWGHSSDSLESTARQHDEEIAVSVFEEDSLADAGLCNSETIDHHVWFDWKAAASDPAASIDLGSEEQVPVPADAVSEPVSDPFAEEFHEEFDLSVSTRIVLASDVADAPTADVLSGPTEDACSLQPIDVQAAAEGCGVVAKPGPHIPVCQFEPEEALHREVISLTEVAEQTAAKAENAVPKTKRIVLDMDQADTDDRDLLIVEDTVPQGEGKSRQAPARRQRNDYKSLFSQLRNG